MLVSLIFLMIFFLHVERNPSVKCGDLKVRIESFSNSRNQSQFVFKVKVRILLMFDDLSISGSGSGRRMLVNSNVSPEKSL